MYVREALIGSSLRYAFSCGREWSNCRALLDKRLRTLVRLTRTLLLQVAYNGREQGVR
jgi:hypothetical protein